MEKVNIVKLCVGATSIEDLSRWQESNAALWPAGQAAHVTRMWPKREAEVLEGSLYWVIKGVILCRQKILDLKEVKGGDGISRCALMLDRKIIRTESMPRRAFQGWRYLNVTDSPQDLAQGRLHEEKLPPALERALAEIGLR